MGTDLPEAAVALSHRVMLGHRRRATHLPGPLTAMLALAGCAAPAFEGDPAADPPQYRSPWSAVADPPAERNVDPIVLVSLQFDILRIELPATGIDHAEGIWSHVDELRGDATQAIVLRRNGLRAGVAPSEAWPALRAVFDAAEASVHRATHVVQPGSPLSLDLGEVKTDESVFLISADGRMAGRTFPRGQKYLHLDYEVRPGGNTVVRATPEIHSMSQDKRWRRDGDSVTRGRDYRGRTFHELAGTFELNRDEFLVLGPDTIAAPALSLGRRFLNEQTDRGEVDIVFCITPQMYRTEARGR